MVEINSQNLFLCSVGVILFGIKNHTIKPTALIIDMDVFFTILSNLRFFTSWITDSR